MSDLPLVREIAQLFEEKDLRKVAVIGIQHLLETTLDLISELSKRGLDIEDVSLLGKCYSSSYEVVRKMKIANIYVSPYSFSFSSDQSFDKQFAKLAKLFLKSRLNYLCKNKEIKKIILLDDGGHLIKAAHDLLEDLGGIVAIEQTSSGFHFLKTLDLKCPVINVARSPAKLIYESPMIAATIAENIYSRLREKISKNMRILIIGGGPIGQNIFRKMHLSYDISIYDKNIAHSMISDSKFPEILSDFDIIIGCTGNTAIMDKHFKFLKYGAILISASSSDREFNAVRLRKKLPKFLTPHSNLEVDGIKLLNCGFPINFNGEKHSVPPSLIQLTRALLACGMLQALTEENLSNGIIPLDIELQRDVVRKFFKLCPEHDYRNTKKIDEILFQ